MRSHEAGVLHAPGYGGPPIYLPTPTDVMEFLPQLWARNVRRGEDDARAGERMRRAMLGAAPLTAPACAHESDETRAQRPVAGGRRGMRITAAHPRIHRARDVHAVDRHDLVVDALTEKERCRNDRGRDVLRQPVVHGPGVEIEVVQVVASAELQCHEQRHERAGVGRAPARRGVGEDRPGGVGQPDEGSALAGPSMMSFDTASGSVADDSAATPTTSRSGA